MPELKPKMFRESEKSSVSENLIANIVSFVLIMAIILVAESVIPWIMARDRVYERLEEMKNAGSSLSFSEIRDATVSISMESKIFIVMLFCTAFGTIISMLYCRYGEARPLRSMGVTKHKAGLHYAQGALVGAVLMSTIALGSVICRVSDISLCKDIGFGVIFLTLLGFLVQGMSEEFIFRGFFMNTLGGRHHPFVAIGVSAVAFSLAHVLNPGYGVLVFINLTMFGVFAGLYMIAFDDIWGACAIHSVWNFLQGSFYGISVSGSGMNESVFRTTARSSSKLLTGGAFGIEGSIFTTVVLAAGIAAVWWRLSKAPADKTE
ncbi:MAG: CPBP family intramembrane metalloprotease [Ruminococcus sp.]|nr:CPBP family intramembrane metalloprotease [Ruminococcus sp.]